MNRAKNILLRFLFVFLTFSFVGVSPVEAADLNGIGNASIWQKRKVEGETVDCYLYGSCVEDDSEIYGFARDLKYSDGTPVPDGTVVEFEWDWKALGINNKYSTTYKDGKTDTYVIKADSSNLKEDASLRIIIQIPANSDLDKGVTKYFSGWTNTVSESCDGAACSTNPDVDHVYKICNQINKETEEYARCLQCFSDKRGVWTAVGCIPQDPTAAVASIVKNWSRNSWWNSFNHDSSWSFHVLYFTGRSK